MSSQTFFSGSIFKMDDPRGNSKASLQFQLKKAVRTIGPGTDELGVFAQSAIKNKSKMRRLVLQWKGDVISADDPRAKTNNRSIIKVAEDRVFVPEEDQLASYMNDPMDKSRENCELVLITQKKREVPGIYIKAGFSIQKNHELLGAYGERYWRFTFKQEPDRFSSEHRRKAHTRYLPDICKLSQKDQDTWASLLRETIA